METVLNTSNRRGKKRKEEKEKERKRGGSKETNIQEYKYLNQRRFFIETLVIVPFNSPKFADEEKKKTVKKNVHSPRYRLILPYSARQNVSNLLRFVCIKSASARDCATPCRIRKPCARARDAAGRCLNRKPGST